jgi:predicted acylesterase/phospholipase RssA
VTQPELKELRLALGMRGGVSLAVWIGGACSEIDLTRRAADAGPSAFWRETLGYSQYDKVVVDVLAGASAGGLNGVLYAASQIYDFPYSAMRATWLKLGGTEDLVRREPPWPSLFAGDSYFLAKVHEQLVELVGTRQRADEPPPSRSPTVDLRLSATLMEPVSHRTLSPVGEPLDEPRSTSGFHFRHSAHDWLTSDFPPFAGPDGEPNPEFDVAMWRLAVAARATSSYPAAFEAAAVQSNRGESFGSPPVLGGAAGRCDLGRTFLDRQGKVDDPDDAVFTVADGGVLDNIPLGRALDAVATAPADGPTDRFLVYLQPGQPKGKKPSPRSSGSSASAADPIDGLDTRRSTIGVIRGILRARVTSETITRDIAQLDTYNDEVDRASALRRASFQNLSSRGAFVAAAEAEPAREGYALQRGEGDTRLTLALLEEPIGSLGEDPFPLRVANRPISDDQWRSPLGTWTSAAKTALKDGLRETFHQRVPNDISGVLTVGTRPLSRLCVLLLDWARYLESTGAAEAGVQKARLYRVWSFVQSSLERPRRLAWVAATAGLCAPEVDGSPSAELTRAFARITPASVDQLVHVTDETSDEICASLLGGDSSLLVRFRERAHGRIDDVVDSTWAAVARNRPSARRTGTDLRAAIVHSVLLPIAGELAQGSTGVRRKPGSPPAPGWYLDRVLARKPVDERALAALEIHCYREFATGRPGRRRIEFVHLSSGNRTPIAGAFDTLRQAAAEQDLWWRDQATPDRPGGIHSDLKLAGNELSNFSAFLRAEWRANDWLWGRLDAVPTLVDLIVQPRALQGHFGGDPARAMSLLEEWVAPPGHPLRDPLLAEVWERSRGEIAGEIAALCAAESPEHCPIPKLRDALIARRQWEILADELAFPQDPLAVSGSALTRTATLPANEVQRRVSAYRVGAETLKKPPRPEMADRFTEIADAAAEAVLWNLRIGRPGASPRTLSTTLVNLLRRGLKWGARLAIRRLVAPSRAPGARRRSKALVSLVAMLLVALAVAGLVIDKWAFLVGLAIGLVLLALGFILGYRRLRKLLATDPPPVSRPPSRPQAMSAPIPSRR